METTVYHYESGLMIGHREIVCVPLDKCWEKVVWVRVENVFNHLTPLLYTPFSALYFYDKHIHSKVGDGDQQALLFNRELAMWYQPTIERGVITAMDAVDISDIWIMENKPYYCWLCHCAHMPYVDCNGQMSILNENK